MVFLFEHLVLWPSPFWVVRCYEEDSLEERNKNRCLPLADSVSRKSRGETYLGTPVDYRHLIYRDTETDKEWAGYLGHSHDAKNAISLSQVPSAWVCGWVY